MRIRLSSDILPDEKTAWGEVWEMVTDYELLWGVQKLWVGDASR